MSDTTEHTKVEDIFKNKPHYAVIAMCVACSKRWIGTVIAGTSLFRLECPDCSKQDSFASFLPEEYLGEFAASEK